MKRITLLAVALATAFAFGAPAAQANYGAFHGTAADPNYPQFGDFTVLANKAGAKFSWTQVTDLGPFVAGHKYVEIDKVQVDDPENWCGPNEYNVGRLPWTWADEVSGDSWLYYQQFDATTGERLPC